MRSSRNLLRVLPWTLAALGLLAWAAPSQAYRMIQNTSLGRVTSGTPVTCNDPGGFAHWTTPNITWYNNTAGQGSGKATALSSAIAAWTNVGAGYTLSSAGTTTAGWATDGTNTILWASGNGCTGSCLALTALVLQTGQVIVESDITFNSAYTWNTNGTDYDTRAVATHELGHSLGIHHTEITTTPQPTMLATYFGTGGRTLESDDQQALQCSQSRYPTSGGGGGGTVPGVPTLSAESGYCKGQVLLSWTSSAGATYYELEHSASYSFTVSSLVYSGTATSLFRNGSGYYRVRACNSNGCSGYSNIEYQQYYSVCQ